MLDKKFWCKITSLKTRYRYFQMQKMRQHWTDYGQHTNNCDFLMKWNLGFSLTHKVPQYIGMGECTLMVNEAGRHGILREHCSRNNSVRLWKDLCNSSKLGCGSNFYESFPQNVESFPQMGIFKPIFPWFDELILSIVAMNNS